MVKRYSVRVVVVELNESAETDECIILSKEVESYEKPGDAVTFAQRVYRQGEKLSK